MKENSVSGNDITLKGAVNTEYVMNENRVNSNGITLKYDVSLDYEMNSNKVGSNAITPNSGIPIIDLCLDTDSIVYSDHLKIKVKITKKVEIEYLNNRSDCDRSNADVYLQDCVVDLSRDEKIIETSVAFKANCIIIKYPVLDYGIASDNNLTNNDSPKLINQLNFNLIPT